MQNKSIKYILLSVTITSSLLFTACGHEHTFADATCTTPKTCAECGQIEGEALGHAWVDATCENPKTCSVCNLTEGNPLDHTWLEATTEAPKTCEVCGLTEGERLLTIQEEQETQAEVPTQHSPEYQQMLEDLVKEIYNSGDSYIPADPAVEAALGGTHGTTESTGGIDWDAPSNPKFAGGSLE